MFAALIFISALVGMMISMVFYMVDAMKIMWSQFYY